MNAYRRRKTRARHLMKLHDSPQCNFIEREIHLSHVLINLHDECNFFSSCFEWCNETH